MIVEKSHKNIRHGDRNAMTAYGPQVSPNALGFGLRLSGGYRA